MSLAAQQFFPAAHLPEPDLAVLGAGCEPLAVGSERERCHGAIASLPGPEWLVGRQIPEMHGAIGTARSPDTAIGGDDHNLHGRRMAREVLSFLASAKVPQAHAT